MKFEKNQFTSCFIIILITILMMFSFMPNVLARDNFAYSVATTYDGIDTRQSTTDAAYAYGAAGYNSYATADPTISNLWGKLYADVQFFNTHGNVNNIQFANSGIAVGNRSWGWTGKDNSVFTEFIGTNEVHWDADTILVTYMSCNSAGTNGNIDYNSIAYKTAVRGANVTVGFRNTIKDASAASWAKRYNERLAQGYGVLDSLSYANSFIYLFNNVKENVVFSHGNPNMRIGKYFTNSVSNKAMDVSNLSQDRNIIENKELIATNNNIFYEIKKNDVNFKEENYETKVTRGTDVVNVLTGEVIKGEEYIDVQLKIGDFYTNAGYSIKVQDGVIKEIYDNNIDIFKQEQALQQKDSFKKDLYESKLSSMKEKASMQIRSKYDRSDLRINDDLSSILYYYEIETGKKYAIITVLSEIGYGETLAIAYDTVQYELY